MITNANDTIQVEIYNLEIQNQGDLNVNKDLYRNTTHTDYTFQRNNTTHSYDNNRSLLLSKTILHINEKVTKSYKFKH